MHQHYTRQVRGCAAAGENRDLNPVLVGDGSVTRRNLLEGIAVAASIYLLVLLRGKPYIWVSQIGRWQHYLCRSTSSGIVFGAASGWWWMLVEWCSFTTSTSTS